MIIIRVFFYIREFFMDLIVLDCLGIGISLYAVYVFSRIKKNSAYRAVCDISDKVSCTKTMISPYGSYFGISLVYVALGFYSLILVLALFKAHMLIFVVSLLGVIASGYFAYLQYWKLKLLCLICTSLYIINILLLLVSWSYIS